MYEAGDIIIMSNGEELKVIYVSGNNDIVLRNTTTKKIVTAQVGYMKTPKKVVKAN